MLTIEGGRPRLYQWDIDQRLEVDNDEVLEVHFVNAVTSPALVCEVYEENGRRFADVPNVLLQQFWPIQAYGCCNSRVRDVETIKVIRREKPADYVYTETEVKRFDDLERQVKSSVRFDLSQELTKTQQDMARRNINAMSADTEIPSPYDLPPATADTLGGVKIGDGLVADEDGRVSVKPDGGYELIETIKVNDDGVAEIVRDGYKLDAVRITVLTGACELNGNSFLRLFTNAGHQPTLGSAYLSRGETVAMRYELYKNGGVWDGNSTGGVWGNGGTPILGMNRQNELITATKDDYITSIRFYTLSAATPYPPGTEINVYGVRHDA